MAEERVIWEAQFNDRVTIYWLLGGAIMLALTCVGALLLPVWIVLGMLVTRRYLETYRCTLTNRSLKVSRGLLVKVERTIPLDRITDVGLVQGPLMRMLDIEALSVETAGQSTPGSLVRLVGIVDGRSFRDAILHQRDLVVGSEEDRQARLTAVPAGTPLAAGDDANIELLRAIYGVLRRIEERLEK